MKAITPELLIDLKRSKKLLGDDIYELRGTFMVCEKTTGYLWWKQTKRWAEAHFDADDIRSFNEQELELLGEKVRVSATFRLPDLILVKPIFEHGQRILVILEHPSNLRRMFSRSNDHLVVKAVMPTAA